MDTHTQRTLTLCLKQPPQFGMVTHTHTHTLPPFGDFRGQHKQDRPPSLYAPSALGPLSPLPQPCSSGLLSLQLPPCSLSSAAPQLPNFPFAVSHFLCLSPPWFPCLFCHLSLSLNLSLSTSLRLCGKSLASGLVWETLCLSVVLSTPPSLSPNVSVSLCRPH